jgi:hypothetical protein
MTDNRFVPHEPRRRMRPVSALAQPRDAEEAPQTEQPSFATTESAPREPICESDDAPIDAQVPACERCAARACDDGGIDPRLIRAAAIPLAAAACARALRYAIDRNPRLIVRFVDDALAAAGAAARRATIRMAPNCIAAFDPERAHAVTADEELGPGDVFIDTPAGTIGALLAERADLLVRSAAG